VNPYLDRWRSAEGKEELRRLQRGLDAHDKEVKGLRAAGLVKYLVEARQDAVVEATRFLRECAGSSRELKEHLYVSNAVPHKGVFCP